jgi:uncharacterized protein
MMTDLNARLRDVIGVRRRTEPAPLPPVAMRDAAQALGGTVVEHESGRCLLVERDYRASHRHGAVAVGDLALSASACHAVTRLLGSTGSESPAADSLMFVDLETTGLAGGAGTHAFLVGCGWFEGNTFRVCQFFLEGFRDEPALLALVAARIGSAGVLVSFNGKTFDLPLIETRYLFHRMAPPCVGKPHLDLLHPSRRLWRGPEGCSLSVLERRLFGVHRDEDVPGFDIPGRYFEYIRRGNAAALAPVLEHNRADLLSVALMTAYVTRLIEGGAEFARDGEECFGLGGLYERFGGDDTRAMACYERAARLAWRMPARRVEALRCLGRLYRRARRHADALRAWQEVLDCGRGSPIAFEAMTALAIHHEHRSRDLTAAERFARLALDSNAQMRRAAAEYRLARLERKLARIEWRLPF